MNVALWTQIRETFSELVELSPSERESRLSHFDPEVRCGVQEMLQAHDSAGGFLEPSIDEQEGMRLGPYRLIEKIGEGGMGVVYRAERDDGEFHREVAIKFVGGRLLATEGERRFVQEREILARLDHPNIVRMLDGGVSEGRRYLVMEYIRGESLTDYCRNRRLPLSACLRLFADVAAAVGCAHRNLIIHRDLKPGNILVTEDGAVKVLDFGIAQLLESSDTEAAAKTAFNPWTLACASPEQVKGYALTIATDIYSLGVLLYELLTGVNPQWSSGKTVDETIRRICEQDPKPPRQIQRSIAPDLDAIVLKTLAKNPQDRYSSAEDLRADVQRFLDGLPVLAQSPSAAYRLGKWMRRNKVLSAVSGSLILAVLAGLAAVAWQARIAEQQRDRAERRFDEARRLIRTVIHDIQPKMGAISGTAALRKTLIDSTLGYLEALTRDAGDNPALLRELADAYVELAAIQGNAATTNLGDPKSAAATLEKAYTLVNRVLALDGNNPESLQAANRCLRALAGFHINFRVQSLDKTRYYTRRAAEVAEQLMRMKPDETAGEYLALSLFSLAQTNGSPANWMRALEAYETLLKTKPADPSLLRNVARIHKNLSGWYLTTEVEKRDARKALEHGLIAMEIDERLLVANPNNPEAQLDFAIDLSQVSSSYRDLGDLPKALSFMRRSVEIREEIVKTDANNIRAQDRLAYALTQQGYYRAQLGDPKGSLTDHLRVVSMYEKQYARKSTNTQMMSQWAFSHHEIGRLLKQSGRAAEACLHFRQSARRWTEREKMGDLTGYELDNRQKYRIAAEACGQY